MEWNDRVVVLDHPIVQHKLAILRDKHTPSNEFRDVVRLSLIHILMAIPNIIVILLLSGMIARETRHYVYDGNLDEEYGEPVPRVKGSQL